MASRSDVSPPLWAVSAGVARPDVRPPSGIDHSGGQQAGEASMPKPGEPAGSGSQDPGGEDREGDGDRASRADGQPQRSEHGGSVQ